MESSLISRVCLIGMALVFAVSCSAVAQTVDFEVAEGFSVGGAWPAGWSSSSSGGGVAQVSTLHPTSGLQCVEFGTNLTGAGWIKYYPSWGIPADTKMRLQFDIKASPYSPPNGFDYSGYGGIHVYDPGYAYLGGMLFALEAGDFKLKFLSVYQQLTVGTFVPGTYYRYTLIIDRAANETTHRLEVIGGGTVAERTYSFSAASIYYIYFAGSQTPGPTPAYADRLVFGEYSAADFGGDPGVDVVDYSIFAAAWGSSAGPPADAEWNPLCDLEADGVIDGADLMLFFEEWLGP